MYSPLQQWGGWQDGSQYGTAISAPQQLQVSQHSGGFLPLQQNFGPIEQLQQQLGSLKFSGIPPTQSFTESQQPQPFTGIQQPQQQIESFSETKQQFEPFTGPQQPQQQKPQLFSMPQYPQQQQYFAGVQPAQQLLTGIQQPQQSQQQFNWTQQQITGAQQQFKPLIGTYTPQHLHSFAMAGSPHFARTQQLQQQFTTVQQQQQQQEQFIWAQLPPQQSFGILQPQGQFNVAQQPEQLAFTGNQQQFETVQQPWQQFRTRTGSHQQQQPIQPALLQSHQQHPVSKEGAFNPFTVS